MLLGLGAGAYGVLIGAGGGIILAPILLLFFHAEPEVAAGTSLALVSVNSFSGTVVYARLGVVDRRSGLLFAAAAVPGSVIGPFIVSDVGGATFRVLFGLLLVGLAAYILSRRQSGNKASGRSKPMAPFMMTERRIISRRGQVFEYRFNEFLATSFNLFLGFISAFFGTGGGFVRTPVLVAAFDFPVLVAVASSVFALSIYATVGALVHALLSNVDWYPTFLWAGIGLIVGGQLGARMAAKIQAQWIMRLLVLLLLIIGVRLLMQGVLG